ncbi:MAG TPA: D-arabinono-1,4-lactone oxidase, partial [Terriglobales bacterium]|nr:D-arabinono-1,4-lactone oxidase [Terriglobales bacterium]
SANVDYPKTVEQLQALVKQYGKLRVLGTRHSFNSIADSTEHLISMERFAPEVNINRERNSVTISANVTYGQLAPILHREGFALHNLASLPHISVVGAITTATHGSGVRNRNLASAVSGLELVAADGNLVSFSRERDGELFNGAVVGLGGLGVIVKLTLDLLPAFEMSQDVYTHLPVSQLEEHFDAIMSSAYSVSLFTDWQGDSVNQVWLKKRFEGSDSDRQSDFFGAKPASRGMHPIGELSAEQCTEQLGVRGPWHERLPHFRIDATPSAGDELQSEYFVARSDAVEAILAIRDLREAISPHLLISEIRTIAADDLWMSPCYDQDSVAIHFTWKQDWPTVSKVLPLIESQLAPFNAKPHWGKLFTMLPRHVQSRYEKLPNFKQLLQQYDPQGKFRNAFLDTTLFGS